jgi:hypothetical protein
MFNNQRGAHFDTPTMADPRLPEAKGAMNGGLAAQLLEKQVRAR